MYVLLIQDPYKRVGVSEEWLKTSLPHTYNYLYGFRNLLSARANYKKYYEGTDAPFYTMFNVTSDTVSPFAVTWGRMASDLNACVISEQATPVGMKKPLPLDTATFVPLDNLEEAHYLCALLNNSLVRGYVRSFSSAGRGFGSPAILTSLKLERYQRTNSRHTGLARHSQRAHELAARLAGNPADEDAKRELAEVEDQIDHAAAQLWDLTDQELDEIRNSLKLMG